MVVQAILEIVFLLLVAAFIGYKIGSLIEQRKNRTLRYSFTQKEQKVEELNFDLNHCIQVRRRLQSRLFDLQKQLEVQSESPLAMVDAKGTVITPRVEVSQGKKK